MDTCFTITDKKGGNGIVDSGEMHPTKNGLGGAEVYLGTTPNSSTAIRNPNYGLPLWTKIARSGKNVPLK